MDFQCALCICVKWNTVIVFKALDFSGILPEIRKCQQSCLTTALLLVAECEICFAWLLESVA